jgi:hypothetical protein
VTPQPQLTTPDRHMAIPAGYLVITGYVSVEKVRLGCRDRMSVGDVETAYRKLLQLGDQQPFPCPNGEWDGDTFVIHDGRHEYVASLMLGKNYILVAWIEPQNKAAEK